MSSHSMFTDGVFARSVTSTGDPMIFCSRAFSKIGTWITPPLGPRAQLDLERDDDDRSQAEPKLNQDQGRAIAQDYCVKEDRLHVPIRLALIYYFVRRLSLD